MSSTSAVDRTRGIRPRKGTADGATGLEPGDDGLGNPSGVVELDTEQRVFGVHGVGQGGEPGHDVIAVRTQLADPPAAVRSHVGRLGEQQGGAAGGAGP